MNQEPLEYENYSEISNFYDSTRKAIGYQKILSRLKENFHVLDAGCGTGNYTLNIAPHVHKITALDQNEGMISQAQQKVMKNNLSNVTFVKSSLLENLPFEDNTFDAIMINQVVHHLDINGKYDNFKKLIKEFQRVLKKGGILSLNHCNKACLDSIWYIPMLKEARQKLRERFIDSDEIKQVFENSGFEFLEKVPEIEPFMGLKYFNLSGVFDQNYRNGDSTFALIDEKTLREFLTQVKNQMDDGSFIQNVIKSEKIRMVEGQSQFYFGMKK